MNRRLTGLLAAVALALVGTVVLVGYVRSAEARALSGERLVDVLVVSEPIESGTKATDLEDKVRTEQVPAKVRADDAVADLDDLGNRVAAVDLVPGEQLVTSRFVDRQVQARGDVPSGLLEVTVPLDPARALGGRIAAGDTVGVIASVADAGDGKPATHLILHKVLVTAVQAASPLDPADEEEAKKVPNGDLLVTLALDAGSVERVVFAAEHGSLWLSAEPTDAPEGTTSVQRMGSVLG